MTQKISGATEVKGSTPFTSVITTSDVVTNGGACNWEQESEEIARNMAKPPVKNWTKSEMCKMINGINTEVMDILCQPSNKNGKLQKHLDQARFVNDANSLDLGFDLDELIDNWNDPYYSEDFRNDLIKDFKNGLKRLVDDAPEFHPQLGALNLFFDCVEKAIMENRVSFQGTVKSDI